jgi:hypothetical protein
MATAKQIQLRIKQTKKTLVKLNKELAAAKNKLKTLEAQLKKAGKSAVKPKAKKKAAPKKKVSKKRR